VLVVGFFCEIFLSVIHKYISVGVCRFVRRFVGECFSSLGILATSCC
jgi:hypothetical protein